jgi:hypothetical protein
MITLTFPDMRPPGNGPWTTEPDKAQWVDEATGLDCLIVRNRGGALCGYVGLPPGHRAHGVDYDDVTPYPDVHGGLTFAGPCQEDNGGGRGICHVPEPGRPADVWWLGFDCAHAGDMSPRWADHLPASLRMHEVYRDFDYVKAEVERLAAQLADQGGGVTNR